MPANCSWTSISCVNLLFSSVALHDEGTQSLDTVKSMNGWGGYWPVAAVLVCRLRFDDPTLVGGCGRGKGLGIWPRNVWTRKLKRRDMTYTRIGNRIHWLFRRQFRFAVQMTWPVTQRHVLIESLNRGFFCENRFAHERPKWDGTNPLGWVNTCSWHVGCDVRTRSFIFVRNVLHFIHTFSVSRLQLGPRISPHKRYAWWECYAVNQESFGLLTLNWSRQSWMNFSRFVFHLAHGSHQ